MPIMKIQDLSKSYDELVIIENFNLEIDKGEIIGLEGPTGAGKTTLFRCIAGLENYSGSIDVEGEISYLFQDLRLLPWLNIRKNILLPLKLKGEKIDESDLNRIKELSKSLGIDDHLDKEIEDVSGGQKQRILLLRALITDPDILLLDEPFKSLDSDTRIKSYREIINLCRNEGKTVLVASHYKDIEKFTDRTINSEEFR